MNSKKLDLEKLNEQLTNRLNDNIREAKVAGAEIIVKQCGEQAAHLIIGTKDNDRGTSLKGGELYRLASMTKPVTAVAAMIGVGKGWLCLDDDVKDYLPEFGGMYVAEQCEGGFRAVRKAHSELKIYQMLSHLSGMLAETELGNMILESADKEIYDSRDKMLRFAASAPLAFDPGEYTAYSAFTSFDVIARILEMKSGLRFSEFINRYIFDPLGIKDITFHPTEDQWSRLVTMHDRSDSKSLVTVNLGRHAYETNGLDYECAGGGLIGSADDYSKFAEMLLNKGEYNGVRILAPELVEEIYKPRVADDIPGRSPNDSWGLGVRVKVHKDWLPEGTYGWSGAYGTHFWVDPENKITAVLLRNMRWYGTCGAGLIGEEFEKDVMDCLVD